MLESMSAMTLICHRYPLVFMCKLVEGWNLEMLSTREVEEKGRMLGCPPRQQSCNRTEKTWILLTNS